MKREPPRVGDVIELEAERLAYGGDAVAHQDGLAVFIPRAAPGDRLRVRVTERKKNFARAEVVEVLAPSPARRQAPCPYFGRCGGCQLQHISYEAQLEAKRAFVRDALARVGRINWPREIEVRHAEEFGYRTRAQLKVAPLEAGASRRVGFNYTASHNVCDVTSCPILVPELNAALDAVRREVAAPALAGVEEIEIAAGEGGVSFGWPLSELGPETVERQVRGARYRFSPEAFFQVNASLLNDLVAEAVEGYAGDLAIDLYAGVGLFTIQLARGFRRVVGVEAHPRAARFARENIAANGATKVHFCNDSTEGWLRKFLARRRPSDKPPDLILLDPPRGGAAEALDPIIEIRPRNICYVSCDPATLARDLRRVIDAGYELERVTAFDLFPQTYHVETVARLTRSSR